MLSAPCTTAVNTSSGIQTTASSYAPVTSSSTLSTVMSNTSIDMKPEFKADNIKFEGVTEDIKQESSIDSGVQVSKNYIEYPVKYIDNLC